MREELIAQGWTENVYQDGFYWVYTREDEVFGSEPEIAEFKHGRLWFTGSEEEEEVMEGTLFSPMLHWKDTFRRSR